MLPLDRERFPATQGSIQPVSSMRASMCSMEALLYGSCPARVEPECTRRRAVGSGCGVRAAHRLDRPDGEWASLPHRNPADRRHGAWRRRSNSTGRAARVAAELGTEDVVRSYKQLSRVERAFRTLKGGRFGNPNDWPILNDVYAHMSCWRCLPTTSNGICAKPGRHCCSKTSNRPWRPTQ